MGKQTMQEEFTIEQEEIKRADAALDPIHFIDEYCKAFDVTKDMVSNIKCFPYQRGVIDSFLDHRWNIILKSRQCLPIGTKVNTPDGIKSIEDFKPGDKVWSYNLETNTTEEDVVYDAWKSGIRNCVKFKLRDGRSFVIGENHPLYTEGKGWVKAKNLKKDDEIKFKNVTGVSLAQADAVIVSITQDEPQVCYDIAVDKNENFFVDGLLTHNTGISVITACYVAWRMIFGVDETIVIIANNQDGAARFLKHVKNVLIQLPEFLYSKKRDEVSFATMKVELSNGNQAIAKAAGKNAGRGDSPTLLVLDEWAFADDDEDIWTAAGPSLSQTEGDCIVISTPRGTGNQFHKMWVEAEKGDGPFNPIRVHWVENPKASAGLEYRIDQDGSRLPWSPWYEARCQEYQYDQVKIAQELDLSFSGSKLLALDPIEIARQKNRILHEKIKPKIYFDTDPRSTDPLVSRETSCHIFEEPKPGETFIIACDVAYKGIDKSTIQVINAKTLNQAAEYQGKIDPDRFAHLIAKIAYWYNTAFVVVEANNHGLVTGFELRNKIKYPNLYESKSSNPKAIHVRAIDYVVHMGDGIPGFQTTAASRPSVVNSIRAHMRETDVRINSSRLINEMDVFIRNEKKGGKEEAEKGYHDDLVMAYGIALYILSTEYYNQNMAKSRARAMLDAISFSTNELEGKQETPEEKSRRLESEKKFEDDDFVPPGAGGLWINKSEDEDEDDFNDTSWLLG